MCLYFFDVTEIYIVWYFGKEWGSPSCGHGLTAVTNTWHFPFWLNNCLSHQQHIQNKTPPLPSVVRRASTSQVMYVFLLSPVFRGSRICWHLDFRLWTPNHKRINICCLKSPSWWWFVTAALRNYVEVNANLQNQRKLGEMRCMRRGGIHGISERYAEQSGDLEGLQLEADKCVCKTLNTWPRRWSTETKYHLWEFPFCLHFISEKGLFH